jgi:N-acetylglucosamine kinase-like BadF-type ATPase
MSIKIKIEFEVDESVSPAQLHELLCTTIHEGDELALAILEQAVVDIVIVEEVQK